MSAGTFGAPIYNESDDPTVAGASDTPVEILDPNDPIFTSEPLDVNPEVDAYAFPPPPPDGRYRAKLKLLQREDATKQKVDFTAARWGSNPPQMVLVGSVEASIIDPSGKFDGVKVYDRLVSTFVSKQQGMKAATILARLKRPDGTPWVTTASKPGSAGAWMQLLKQALAGEPEIGIETTWEWSCADCAKAVKAANEKTGAHDKPARAIVGMHKFPRLGNAYQPEMKCQVSAGHGESRAQVRIARFLSEAELKGTGK